MTTTKGKFKALSEKNKTTFYKDVTYKLSDTVNIIYHYVDGKFASAEFKYVPKLYKKYSKRLTLKPTYLTPEFKTEVVDKGLNVYHLRQEDKYEMEIPENVNDIIVENIYLFYWSGHLLFNQNEQIIPMAYTGNYTEGSFDNGHYRLNELLPYLKEHPLVVKDYDIFDDVQEEYWLTISDVPYYNSSKGCRRTINFKVIPEQSSYQELLMKTLEEKDNFYFSNKLREYILGQYGKTYNGVDYLGLEPYRKKKKSDE